MTLATIFEFFFVQLDFKLLRADSADKIKQTKKQSQQILLNVATENGQSSWSEFHRGLHPIQ